MLAGHGVIGMGVDIGVVEPLLAPRPGRQQLHVGKGLGEILGGDALEFEDLDMLVGVAPLKMLRQLGRGRPGSRP